MNAEVSHGSVAAQKWLDQIDHLVHLDLDFVKHQCDYQRRRCLLVEPWFAEQRFDVRIAARAVTHPRGDSTCRTPPSLRD